MLNGESRKRYEKDSAVREINRKLLTRGRKEEEGSTGGRKKRDERAREKKRKMLSAPATTAPEDVTYCNVL